MDACYNLYCDFRDAHVAVHSSYCPLNLLPVHCNLHWYTTCSVPVRSALTSFHLPCMRTSARKRRGYVLMRTKADKGEGESIFAIFLQTSFMDDP